MAKPNPFINGNRVSPINVTISAIFNHKLFPSIIRFDLTDGLISLDYQSFDYVKNCPKHHGNMIISKETWEKFLAAIPYSYQKTASGIYMSIVYCDALLHQTFLNTVTMELFNVEPLWENSSLLRFPTNDVEVTFNFLQTTMLKFRTGDQNA